MASVQCFKNDEKTYYQQSPHGNRMEHAISHSQTECYGQSEKHLPLGQGYMAHGNGNGHGYTGHGHGHMAQAHGHHSEHALQDCLTVQASTKDSPRELHKSPLASVAMASVQCFKNDEKTYYQQSPHGNRMEHAISHSQTECYGQSEKHLPLGQGYMAHGNGNGHGYTGHGHGHMAQAHGHHSEHAMAKTQTRCMGQNNGHHLGQHAQTHCITQAYSHKKESSSCHGKSKKKGEYKKEKIIVKKKSKECKSGDSSSSSSESESDNDCC